MNKVLISICLSLLVLLVSSCNRLEGAWDSFLNQRAPVTFSIDDVTTVSQTGKVSLSGQASLPDDSRLAVSAVRSLMAEPSAASPDEMSYAILARKFVTVKDRAWQAELTLQELDANGSGFESWQVDRASQQDAISPSPTVSFLVTLEPASFSDDVRELLSRATIDGGDTQLSFTSAGEPYLQISRSVAVPVPTGAVSLRDDSSLAEADMLWRDRQQYNPQINAEGESGQLPFAEEDNLPLPANRMLQ